MNHDELIHDWKKNASQREERNYSFLRSLKFRKYGFDPDETAADLHRQAFQIVDCTRCANCCKTMNVRFGASDVERIATQLEMTPAEFIAAYLERDQQGDEGEEVYHAREKPCPLLGPDDRCTVYDVRPTVCREFPHTDKPDFTFRTMRHAANSVSCPAVYWIVEQMRKRAKMR